MKRRAQDQGRDGIPDARTPLWFRACRTLSRFRRLPWAVCFLLGAPGTEAAEPFVTPEAEAAPKQILRWNNGESLAGEIVDGNAEVLRWQSPLFEDPLELQWHVLRRIESPAAAAEVSDPFGFSISLRDGSHILGDVSEITEAAVWIKSQRHGDAVLKRSEVLSIRRLKGVELIWGGPVGDVGWSEPAAPSTQNWSKAPPAVSKLKPGPAGALVLPYWNSTALFSGALPESVDVEFRVRSSLRPDFKIALEGGANRAALNIETWDDEVVLGMSDQFHSIRTLTDADREVALRVCWDRQARKCFVFDAAGEKLAEWQAPEAAAKGDAGITLQNKGRDLTLEFLRVRTWDGKPPAKVDPTRPRLELADGRIVAGRVIRLAGGQMQVRLDGSNGEQELALGSIDALVLSTNPPTAPQPEAILIHADGTFLTGSIASIQQGAILLTTSFSDQPLRSQLSGLRQLLLAARAPQGTPPEKPFGELDALAVADTKLHGRFVPGNVDQPRWLPVGGVTGVTLTGRLPFEINRFFHPDTELPAASALFYTAGWDVLPGTLRSLNRKGVEFDSEILEVSNLPAQRLHAIQFNAGSRMKISGFKDAGWTVVKGNEKTVARTENSLTLEPGGSIGHLSAMQASEIAFAVSSQNYSTMRLRLFCAGTDAAQSTTVLVSHRGTFIYSGLESTDGQLAEQIRTAVAPGKPLTVRLAVQESLVELFLNGMLTQKFAIPASRRTGSGLLIEPAGLWGSSPTTVSLSDFSARSVPGRIWLPDVNAETKAHVLTVPRFRQDDPPRHALIAANGDVLRGEIESLTPTHLKFRSGLESLAVPRDRVKAAIWLKQPKESAAAPVEKSPLQKILDQKVERRTRYSSGNLASLISFLQREASGLTLKAPETADTRTFPFQFGGGQTIGDALEQICGLFGLTYRVVGNTTLMLEAAPAIPKGMVQKSWWLKDDAFAADASAQELLAAKGAVFPPGASAMWQPQAHLLSATNTPENLNKVGEVLDTDFGGSLGSPTHWLLLTSGARLGLKVEEFAQEFIAGTHPLYGRCKIPLPQVYVIRTTMPPPSLAMTSLENWRLVFAPEPVLPQSGGDSSPALGKPAKPFNLPLLAGGEFDLGNEKGNIVVLDFWASWCAPCIKSLPELIRALSVFPADRVKLIGVNQGEAPEQVQRFIEARGWKLTAAMDAGQTVGKLYGVEGIPHTVIIGPDGKVAWVKTGYSAESHTEAAETVKQLLAAPGSE